MTISLAGETINANSPYKVKLTLKWPSSDTITSVKAVLVNTVNDKTDIIEITSETTLTYVSGDAATDDGAIYSGVFPASETAKILVDPENPLSKINYKTVYLAIGVAGTDIDGDDLSFVQYSGALSVGRNTLDLTP